MNLGGSNCVKKCANVCVSLKILYLFRWNVYTMTNRYSLQLHLSLIKLFIRNRIKIVNLFTFWLIQSKCIWNSWTNERLNGWTISTRVRVWLREIAKETKTKRKITLFIHIDRCLSFATHVRNDNVICKFMNSNIQKSRTKRIAHDNWMRSWCIHTHAWMLTFIQSGIRKYKNAPPWKIHCYGISVWALWWTVQFDFLEYTGIDECGWMNRLAKWTVYTYNSLYYFV